MPARGQGAQYQGAKWIRPAKRLALYARDGFACVYCGDAVEDGARLTLDHLTPHCQGGLNHETNLVTACLQCNSSRADRDVAVFAAGVAGYLNRGVTAQQILEHIETTRQRPLDLPAAKALMARRGSYTAALQSRQGAQT